MFVVKGDIVLQSEREDSIPQVTDTSSGRMNVKGATIIGDEPISIDNKHEATREHWRRTIQPRGT